MARRDYYDFLADARETFGLDYDEARAFWRDFGNALGFRPTPDDLVEYGDLAADVLYPLEEMSPEERDAYEEWEREWEVYGERRDFWTWYGDDWLDAYEEIEVTEYVAYQEG